VIRGTYRQVEVIFLFACILYLFYVFSAFLASGLADRGGNKTVLPNLSSRFRLLAHVDGLVEPLLPLAVSLSSGWIVEKKVGPSYRQARADVLSQHQLHGDRFFIIVSRRPRSMFGNRTSRRRAGGAALIPLAAKARDSIRIWLLQCIALRRVHLALSTRT